MNFSISYITELAAAQAVIYSALCCISKCRLSKLFVLAPLFTAGALVVMLFTEPGNNMIFLCYGILYLVTPVLTVKGLKKSKILFTAFSTVGIFALIRSLSGFLMLLVQRDWFFSDIANAIADVTVAGLFILLINFKSVNNFTQRIFAVSGGIKKLFTLFVWEIYILVTTLTVLFNKYPHTPIITFACLFILTVITVSFAAVYLMITNNISSVYYQGISQAIEKDMNAQVEYYNKLTKANEDLRRFRHDFENLKIGLGVYLEKGDISGAKAYLDDCNEIAKKDYIIFDTGNPIADALLSDKATESENTNIEITFEGALSKDIFTPVEVCIVFGNILDNAIEACNKINDDIKKIISITAKQSGDYMFITFTNPVLENVRIINNTILSSKPDKSSHGIGLYSVKHTLEKYDGHISLSCENNVFKTEIDFCI